MRHIRKILRKIRNVRKILRSRLPFRDETKKWVGFVGNFFKAPFLGE